MTVASMKETKNPKKATKAPEHPIKKIKKKSKTKIKDEGKNEIESDIKPETTVLTDNIAASAGPRKKRKTEKVAVSQVKEENRTTTLLKKKEDRKKKKANNKKIPDNAKSGFLNKVKVYRENLIKGLKSLKEAESSGNALFSSEPDQKNPLFPDSDELSVFLEITLKKKPVDCGFNIIRLLLPHPYREPESTNVCLFAKDISKKWDPDVDKDAREYKEYLKFERNVTLVNEVITYSQLRREYREQEAKEQLSTAFDFFVVDRSISCHVNRHLGGAFVDSEKSPTVIDMSKKNIQAQVKRAFGSTLLRVTPKTVTSYVKIGNWKQSQEELITNGSFVFRKLQEKLPGSIPNVRSINLQLAPGAVEESKWPKITLYASLDDKETIDFSHHEKRLPDPVEGDLSTLNEEKYGSSRIKVYPDGRVTLVSETGEETEDFEVDDDGEPVRKGKLPVGSHGWKRAERLRKYKKELKEGKRKIKRGSSKKRKREEIKAEGSIKDEGKGVKEEELTSGKKRRRLDKKKTESKKVKLDSGKKKKNKKQVEIKSEEEIKQESDA